MDDCPAYRPVLEDARKSAENCTDPEIDEMLPYLTEKCNQTINHKTLYLLYDLLKCQVKNNRKLI